MGARPVPRRALSVGALVALLAGCGSTRTVTVEAPPAPPAFARLVPADYRTLWVRRADLGPSPVDEYVVASRGPARGRLAFHSADIQVVSWDSIARRWYVSFDGQKVVPPDALGTPTSSSAGPGFFAGDAASGPPKPLLDPAADVQVEGVRFARLLPGEHEQMVFSVTTSYGGSGVPSTLAVVDSRTGDADIAYVWIGEGLRWRIAGRAIAARAPYWTPADPHCCPSRSYRFAVAPRAGGFEEVLDTRPYLGVLVRSAAASTSLRVEQVDRGGPAAGKLAPGDEIVGVRNPKPTRAGGIGSVLFDQISAFDAGDTAVLEVVHAGVRRDVPVKLGSLRDPSAESLVVPDGDYESSAL